MVFIFQVTLGRTVEGCCGCGALSVEIVAVGERVLWLGGLLMPTLAKERASFSSLVWEDNVCRRTTTLVAPCHMVVVRLLELDWIVGKPIRKLKEKKLDFFFSPCEYPRSTFTLLLLPLPAPAAHQQKVLI